MSTDWIPEADPEAVERARVLLDAATAVSVLTGAGMSTDSGIPDFRGPQGAVDQESQGRADLEHRVLRPRSRGAPARLAGPHGVARAPPPAECRAHRPRRARTPRRAPHARDPERRRPAPGRRHRPRPRSSRCTARSTRRRACPAARADRSSRTLDRVRAGEDDPVCLGVRRDVEVGDRVVRPVARPRRSAAGRTGGRGVRPAARHRLDAERLPRGRDGAHGRAGPGPRSSSSTPSRPRWTTWPTWWSAGRSARCSRPSCRPVAGGERRESLPWREC